MRNSKNIARMLILALLCLGILMTVACNKETQGSDSTGKTDQVTQAPTTGGIETPTEPAVKKVHVSLTVFDQDDVAVKGVQVILTYDEENIFTAVTGDDGKASVDALTGQCKVTFECPEGYLGYPQTITVSGSEVCFALEVENTTPNGSQERPFVFNEESQKLEFPASTTYHCMISNSTRIMKIQNPNVKVIYKDQTYTPDASGLLELLFEAVEDSREPIRFQIVNTATAANEVTVAFEALPGTAGNPHVIKTLGEKITVEINKGSIVYYKWTATEAGTLSLTSLTELGALKMQNNTKSTATEETKASASTVEIAVSAGDEILIYAASGSTAEVSTVEFQLAFAKQ